MRIGELAAKLSVSTKTLRHYEKIGLLPPAARSENGYRVFDFGRSRKESGAFSFKARQGFESKELHYSFRLVKDGGLPTFNPSNPKTKILQRTWQKLPLSITRRLSGPASKFLP